MEEDILKIVADVMEKKTFDITTNSSLDDLWDSLTFIKMVIELENKFDIEFSDEMLDYKRFSSVKSIVLYVKQLTK